VSEPIKRKKNKELLRGEDGSQRPGRDAGRKTETAMMTQARNSHETKYISSARAVLSGAEATADRLKSKFKTSPSAFHWPTAGQDSENPIFSLVKSLAK